MSASSFHDFNSVEALSVNFFGEDAGLKFSIPMFRLQFLMNELGLKSYGDLLQRINLDPDIKDRAMLAFSFHSGEFFRDPYYFTSFRKQLNQFPREKKITVWMPLAGAGLEVYSIAIALFEERGLEGFYLEVSDFNQASIRIIERGQVYADNDRSLYSNYKKGGGKGNVDDYFHGTNPVFKDSVKSLIHISSKDFRNPSGYTYDIIVCRDALLAFRKDTARLRMANLCDAVNPGGLLCLGYREKGPESIHRSDFKPLDFRYGIYRKKEG